MFKKEIEGKVFDSETALKNHVRWRIKKGLEQDVAEFYSKFFEPYVICKFCQTRNCELNSMFKGWSNRCSNASCKELMLKEVQANTILVDGKKDFLEHFKENSSLYLKSYMQKEGLVLEPYSGKMVAREKYLTVLSRHCPSSQIAEWQNSWPTVKGTCSCCKKGFEFSITRENRSGTCGDRSCISWARYNELTPEEKRKKEQQEREEKLLGHCASLNFRGTPINVPVHRSVTEKSLTMYCQDIFSSSGLSLLEFLNESLGGCSSCGKKEMPMKDVRLAIHKRKRDPKANIFCNADCYYDGMRKGFYPASEETKTKQSLLMKEKIRSGVWTPMITNSWGKTRTYVNGNPFRSSWEAAYWICNQESLYEKVRIPYTCASGEDRNYIVDFFDQKGKCLIEIKPDSRFEETDTLIKTAAAKAYAEQNGLTYKVVGDSWFRENYDMIIENAKAFNMDDKFYERMEQFDEKRKAR